MHSLKLLILGFVLITILTHVGHAQILPAQVNTCKPCSSTAECSAGQVCINELDTSTNPTWEWTINELSQIPENY